MPDSDQPDPSDPAAPGSDRSAVPAPLRAAGGLVLVEALLTVIFGIVEAAHISGDRLLLGATTALFFVVYGVGLAACAWGLTHLVTWARSPTVLAQLIFLGLAWNLRSSNTLPVAIGMAVLAVLVIAGVLHPASVDVLNRADTRLSPPDED